MHAVGVGAAVVSCVHHFSREVQISGQYEQFYDGEGRRVKKVKTTTAPATTTETRFVHNAAGALATEYGPSEAGGDTEYFMADHLGSTRLVTSRSEVPKLAFDYLPFGEEIPQGVSGRGAADPPSCAFAGAAVRAEPHWKVRFARIEQ